MGINERKEKQKVELKQQILDASVKLFSEHGYDGVSMRKIAEIVEYSPTTVYLYFKDKNEILFELHEIGFKKMEEFNRDIIDIKNPLLRLHKLGENYLRFGLEYPDYYDLMFLLPAPMEFINKMQDCNWTSGDNALFILKSILQECMDKKLIKHGDVDVMAMAIWGMVHGMVSLTIRKRFEKLLDESEIIPSMNKSLNWLMNTMDTSS